MMHINSTDERNKDGQVVCTRRASGEKVRVKLVEGSGGWGRSDGCRVRNRIIGLEVGKSGGVFGAASKRMLEMKVAPIEGTPSNMKVSMRDAEIDSQYC